MNGNRFLLKPSNVGLDDVVLDNCCWGAKTVMGKGDLIGDQKTVRLISGRNSPTYSFGVDKITGAPPQEIGKLVLDIWNERVSAVRQIYKFVRTVVLVKSKDYKEYLVFEFDTVRYDAELYRFSWNARGNLEGRELESGKHRFTWQPHGSQFTIMEDIPDNRIHLRLKQPKPLDKSMVLRMLEYDRSWYRLL